MIKPMSGVLRLCGVGALLPALMLAAPPSHEAALRAFIKVPENNIVATRRANGLINFLGADPRHPLPETSLLLRPEDRVHAFLKSSRNLFIDATTPLELVTTHVQEDDSLGISHVRVQQTFHGIPVRNAEAIVRLNAAGITAVSSKLISAPPQLSVIPLSSSDSALRTAQTVIVKKYGPVPATFSVPQLEILDPGLFHGEPGQPRLTWFITAGGDALYERIWVNADNGALAYSYSQLTEARNRRIFDANNNSVLPVTSARSEAQPVPSGISDVDDAFNFTGDFWDYFFTVLGRDSYDGKGAALNSIVRYCNSSIGCPFKGAYWDGSLGVQKIFLGQGYATDDVIAHELTHAVIDYTSNLVYSGESGALNESYADIFGETIDLWKDDGDDLPNVRWMIGEELPGYAGTGLRSLSDPPLHGQPGRATDSSYQCNAADNFGVHQNSGVPNHAYALMVDGGVYNGYTIKGIGLDKAARIQYRTLMDLPASSRLADNYDGLNQACGELAGMYGITHDDCAQVKTAALAVEMTTPPCPKGAIPPPPPGAAPAPATAAPGQCRVGQVVKNIFADDFENTNSGNWVASTGGGINHWLGGSGNPAIYFSANPAGGSFALHGGGASQIGDSSVMMKNDVMLSAGALMQFAGGYDFETGFDGSVIEYSLDAGSSWQDAGPLIKYGRNYDGVLFNGSGNPVGGRAAFTGHTGGSYVDSQLDLSALAGRAARFRFRLGTDSLVASPGWWIDNVSIFTCADTTGGVIFTPSQGLRTTEAGGSAGFTVILRTAPTANVALMLASSDIREGLISPPVVTFSPSDWNIPKAVTVTGVDDAVDDGDTAYAVVVTSVVSADPAYNGLMAPGVGLVNADNDDSALIVNPAGGLTTTESGGTAEFTIALKSRPLADVTLNIASSNGREGVVISSSETFTPANWSSPRTVKLKGIDDNVTDGNTAYFVVVNVSSSLDPKYAGLGALTIAATNLDNDSAGFTVYPTGGLTTSESGGKAMFQVRLSSKPIAGVMLALASSNPAEGVVGSSLQTFDGANWDIPQTVEVTGVDDAVLDGNIPYKIILKPAVSSDPVYNGVDAPDIDIFNFDNDTANILVAPAPDMFTSESGKTTTFTLVLTKAPAGNVSIPVSSGNPREGITDRTTVVFTGSNWNKPATVTVTGIDDNVLDGDVLYSIITASALSGDTAYNGMNAPDVFLINRDNDHADVVIAPATRLITTENRDTAHFNVSLAKQPTTNVSMQLISSNPAEGVVTSPPLLFTVANWNIPQTVTVTGQDDNIVDGDINYSVSITFAGSDDPGYRALPALNVQLVNRDNENQPVQPAGGPVAIRAGAAGVLITTEDSGTATFTVSLNNPPSGDVYISLVSSNKSEGKVHPEELSFTTSDWSQPKTVRVVGENDNIIDGDASYFITLTVDAVNSQDPRFASLPPIQLKAVNKDNDKVSTGVLGVVFLAVLLGKLIFRRRSL